MQNRQHYRKAMEYYSLRSRVANEKVNVNSLMKKLKESEKKERNGNIVYASVATAAVIISGIIIAL